MERAAGAEPWRRHSGFAHARPATTDQTRIPLEKSLSSMMVSGELDAVPLLRLSARAQLVDRSTIDLQNHPAMKMLFPDPIAEGRTLSIARPACFQSITAWPYGARSPNSIPGRSLNILKAFNTANDIANRQRMEHAEYHIETGLLSRRRRQGFARCLSLSSWHQIQSNDARNDRAVYSYEQGLTPRLMKLDEIFAGRRDGTIAHF